MNFSKKLFTKNSLFIIMIVFGSLLFYQGSHVIYVPGIFKAFICLTFLFISILHYSQLHILKICNVQKIKNFFVQNHFHLIIPFIIPYILILIYTILLFLLNRLITGQIHSALTMFGSIIAGVMLVPSTFYLFQSNGIYLWIYASILSYSMTIIKYIIQYGMDGIIHFISYNQQGISYLEAHELIFIFGLFLIYLLNIKSKQRKDKILIFILSLFIILGYKRITFLAIGLTLLFAFLFSKIPSINTRKIELFNICLLLFIISYGLLSSIGFDFFKTLASYLKIDFMGRLDLLNFFNNDFSLPNFLTGHGFMYAESKLALSASMKYYSALHNDILRVILDIGFIGFVIIFYCYLIKMISLINKKVNFRCVIFYELIVIYSLVHYATDNLIIYPRFFAMSCMVFFYFCIKELPQNIHLNESEKNYE